MKTDHDKLARRLTEILNYFNEGKRLDVKALSKEFNVSVRTIQKDLNERFNFLPIKKENGVYMLEPYALGKLTYDDIVRFAVFAGVKDLFPDMGKALIVDILNTSIQSSMKVKGINYERLTYTLDMFNAIAGAIVARHTLSFVYNEKSRLVKPYRMVNTQGSWYLVAVDSDGLLKHFAFSKIKLLGNTQTHFDPDETIEQIIDEDETLWYSQNPIDTILAIDNEVREYFLKKEIKKDAVTGDFSGDCRSSAC